jgi:hypothetical protein
MAIAGQIDVFISSTCFDLIDLRAELADYLKSRAMTVRYSENALGDWLTEPGTESMEVCFKNIDLCKVFVFIIDSRYGSPLPGGFYKGFSPIHAELKHARSKGKPPLIFIRSAAKTDAPAIAAGNLSDLRRVSPQDATRWLELTNESLTHGMKPGEEFWWEPFDTVVDLKARVLARIVALHPEYAGSLALQPDRLVRFTFLYGNSPTQDSLVGGFRNIGTGPALNVRHGTCAGSAHAASNSVFDNVISETGGVPEKEWIPYPGGFQTYGYSLKGADKVFCEYRNRFQDRYRVEQPAHAPDAAGHRPNGPERFYVWQGSERSGRWAPAE